MRVFFGCLILVLGGGALGWWALSYAAPRIEARVAEAADAALSDSIHGASAEVSGREIRVTGLADTEDERQALLAALHEVPGARSVADALTVLPSPATYSFTLLSADGALTGTGHAPTAAAHTRIEALLPKGASEITLAAGAPTSWAEAVAVSIVALEQMKEGSAQISGQTLALRGLAALPKNARAVEQALTAAPENFALQVEIDVEDDGRPFALTIDYQRGDEAVAVGKLPVTSSLELLTSLNAPLRSEGLSIARIPGTDPAWEGHAAQLVGALAALESGTLSLTEAEAALSGIGTRAGIAAAQAGVVALSEALPVSASFEILDDGAPIRLTATGPTAQTLTGKLPYQTTAQMLGLETLDTTALRVAEIDAQSSDFVPLAAIGLTSLDALASGELIVEDGLPPRLVLRGEMALPRDIEMLRDRLATAPGEVMLELTPLDDGTPFRLSVEKTEAGLSASGKVPAEATELALAGVETSAFLRVGPENFEETALAGLSALSELPSGRLSVEGATVTLTGAATRAAIARALTALAEVPQGFAIAPDLSPLDDGLPLGLTADKEGDRVTLIGKMPYGSEPSTLGLDAFGEAMIVSEVDARAPDFTSAAQSGLRALAALEDGTLVIRDAEVAGGPPSITLSGAVTRAGLSAVNTAFADLPEGVAPVIDVVFADDGRPMQLSARWASDALSLSGKLPFGSTPGDLGLSAFPPEVEIAEIDASAPGFLDTAAKALEVLTELAFGEMSIEDTGTGLRLTLSGGAQSAADRTSALATLDALDVVPVALTIETLEAQSVGNNVTEDVQE